jgi:hypothetical protein
MATSQLLKKKAKLIKQIESNFSFVSKVEVQQILGISKRMLNYHLYHTAHHAQNINVLEKIVDAQLKLAEEKTATTEAAIEKAKTLNIPE